MAKSYKQINGKHFLTNGSAIVRLGFMHHLNIAAHPGRVIKVFVVADVLKQNPNNPINAGDLLSLSFREQDVNRPEYKWHRGEEFQVPLKIMTADELKVQHTEVEG